jgi:hypothetical protein
MNRSILQTAVHLPRLINSNLRHKADNIAHVSNVHSFLDISIDLSVLNVTLYVAGSSMVRNFSVFLKYHNDN